MDISVFKHKSSSPSWAAFNFWSAMSILGVIALLTSKSLVSFDRASRLRVHTYEVLVGIHELLLNIVNAETGQRGFLITGDKAFLEIYSKSLSKIHVRFDEVRELTRDDRGQQERLDRLQILIAQKLEGLKTRIKLRETKGIEAAAHAIEMSRDRPVMDSIRFVAEGMILEEQNLLKAREITVEHRFRRTEVLLGFGILACAGLLISSFAMLRREIDVRQRTEERVQHLNVNLENKVNELQSLNKDLDSFNYSVSHDLRTPLRAVNGYSQELLLNLGDRLDPSSRSDLTRIRAAASRMGELIDDLLNLSRLARAEMTKESVNLTVLTEGVIQELKNANPARQVNISVAPGIIVHGDRKLLRIVLMNLLSNAWKFTEHQSEASIEMGVLTQHNKQVIFVKDNGAGFDMAYSGKLFGPFQRLHNTDEFPGNGIGLSTVQRIVHRHGGSVWAEGKVDMGATFYFSLP